MIGNITEENCRTCLSYFNEKNGKCDLLNSTTINCDYNRLQLMKNVMNTCSVTLFSKVEDQEMPQVFICTSCMVQIDQMLNFLQKCIHSETILKQTFEKKTNITSGINELKEKSENGDRSSDEDVKILNQNEESSNVEGFESNTDSSHTVDSYSNKNNNKSSNFECCQKSPPILSMTVQKYKHFKPKPHVCVICHENFQTPQLIRRHMAVEHDSAYGLENFCRLCCETFTSKYHLNLHELKVHNVKKYTCGFCKRTFATVSSFKFHENIHLGQQPYSRTSYSKSLVNAKLLKEHKTSVHSGVKLYKCHCGRNFKQEKNLELHVQSDHEKKDELKEYSCSDCGKKFHHPYSLKIHLNTHFGVKPFLCNACGSAFTALSNLTSHLRRIHSGEKQPAVKKYLCHTCGDFFARTSHLQRHTLRKHIPNAERKHECSICKKKFLEKSDMTAHMKLHDDVKPFVCGQCSKCFRTSWRLQAHIKRVHLGLRPFECPTCSVKFKTKSHLKKHIRTHTGEKPFSCPHCSYTCAEKSNLKKHINIHLKAV